MVKSFLSYTFDPLDKVKPGISEHWKPFNHKVDKEKIKDTKNIATPNDEPPTTNDEPKHLPESAKPRICFFYFGTLP